MDPCEGLFLVFAQPRPTLPLPEFHDWYNHEHGPARTALSWITTGARFEATDGQTPAWLALYDISDMSGFARPEYTDLLAHRSARETRIVNEGLETLDRRFYRLESTRGTTARQAASLIVAVLWVEEAQVGEVAAFYDEEHTGLIAKIPGWQSTRRFRSMTPVGEDGLVELLTIHAFDDVNGLGGPEHEAAKETPWFAKMFKVVIKRSLRRTFKFHYAF